MNYKIGTQKMKKFWIIIQKLFGLTSHKFFSKIIIFHSIQWLNLFFQISCYSFNFYSAPTTPTFANFFINLSSKWESENVNKNSMLFPFFSLYRIQCWLCIWCVCFKNTAYEGEMLWEERLKWKAEDRRKLFEKAGNWKNDRKATGVQPPD